MATVSSRKAHSPRPRRHVHRPGGRSDCTLCASATALAKAFADVCTHTARLQSAVSAMAMAHPATDTPLPAGARLEPGNPRPRMTAALASAEFKALVTAANGTDTEDDPGLDLRVDFSEDGETLAVPVVVRLGSVSPTLVARLQEDIDRRATLNAPSAAAGERMVLDPPMVDDDADDDDDLDAAINLALATDPAAQVNARPPRGAPTPDVVERRRTIIDLLLPDPTRLQPMTLTATYRLFHFRSDARPGTAWRTAWHAYFHGRSGAQRGEDVKAFLHYLVANYHVEI